jgi:hypothetical protein
VRTPLGFSDLTAKTRALVKLPILLQKLLYKWVFQPEQKNLVAEVFPTGSRVSNKVPAASKNTALICAILLRPAKHSYSGFAPARLVMSFPRACLARARNPESGAWAGEKTGILRAAATR